MAALATQVVDYKTERPLTGTGAQPITTLMPGTSMSAYNDVPFADALDKAMGTNRKDDALEVYLAKRATWWKARPVTSVPLTSHFVVTQLNVNTARVRQIVDDPKTGGTEPIWMVRFSGKLWTLNGHHRLVADYIRGESSIAARVVDVPSLAKTAEDVDPEFAIPEPQYGWHVLRGTQNLWGKNSWRAMFGNSLTTIAPWKFHRFGPRSPLDKDAVAKVLANPGAHRSQFDPRTLEAIQPSLVRAGVAFYLHDPTYQTSGTTFADQGMESNRIPIVYVTRDGKSVILTGHHRAAAALLKGEMLTALRVDEPPNAKTSLVRDPKPLGRPAHRRGDHGVLQRHRGRGDHPLRRGGRTTVGSLRGSRQDLDTTRSQGRGPGGPDPLRTNGQHPSQRVADLVPEGYRDIKYPLHRGTHVVPDDKTYAKIFNPKIPKATRAKLVMDLLDAKRHGLGRHWSVHYKDGCDWAGWHIEDPEGGNAVGVVMTIAPVTEADVERDPVILKEHDVFDYFREYEVPLKIGAPVTVTKIGWWPTWTEDSPTVEYTFPGGLRKTAGAKGDPPKIIYRWVRKNLVMAVRESDGVSIGEMTIGVLDADTLYVSSVIAQYKRMGIAQGLLEEVHRVHPDKKISHGGFHDRQGLNWGREMSKRFPDWNWFNPTVWDKEEFHLAYGVRKRKPVRRDPRTGLEMCHKKVDGFPCKFIMGHTQGCDVDWNAAYPDEEPEEPENKKSSLRTTAGDTNGIPKTGVKTAVFTLTPAQIAQIKAIVVKVRDGQQGQCGFVAEVLAEKFGWGNYGGFYHAPDGRVIGDHVWNVHEPSGTIIDATADQHGEGHDIKVVHPGDPDYGRYQYGDDEKDDERRWDESMKNRQEHGDFWWLKKAYTEFKPNELPPGYVMEVVEKKKTERWGLPQLMLRVLYEGREVGGLGVHQRSFDGGVTVVGHPNISVNPDHQRKGLASAMYAEVHRRWPNVLIEHSEYASDDARALNQSLKDEFGPNMHIGGYTEFQPPANIIIHSGGDAVPDGWNGYYVAYDKPTGKKMGYLDYNSAPGEPVLIAMVEVDPAYRRRGIATVLLAALRHDFPTSVVVPGYTTEMGGKWWDRAQYSAARHAASGTEVVAVPEGPPDVGKVDSQLPDRSTSHAVAGVAAGVASQGHGGSCTLDDSPATGFISHAALPAGYRMEVHEQQPGWVVGSKITVLVFSGDSAKPVAALGVVKETDQRPQVGGGPTFTVEAVQVYDEHQRQGIASAMYAEVHRRYPDVPVTHSFGPAQSGDARALNDDLRKTYGPYMHLGANQMGGFFGGGKEHYEGYSEPYIGIGFDGPMGVMGPSGKEKVPVPWEGDLAKCLKEAERKAQQVFGDDSTFQKWLQTGVSKQGYVVVVGSQSESRVIGVSKTLGQWGAPIKMGYSEPWPGFMDKIRRDPKGAWVEFCKVIGDAQPPGFDAHPSLGNQPENKVLIYRGITLMPGEDPKNTKSRHGAGMGHSWTLDEKSAKAIAERGGAGFSGDNTRGGQRQKVKAIPTRSFPSEPWVIRAEVDLNAPGVALYTDGRMYYASEQEVNVDEGTVIKVTGYAHAKAVPESAAAKKKALEVAKENPYDDGTYYWITYKWGSYSGGGQRQAGLQDRQVENCFS